MSSDVAKEPVEGDGYAVASLDGLGEGYGFRKIRSGLGVTEFGINAIVMPAGYETPFHLHERQQEPYHVLEGTIEIGFGDDTAHTLEAGGIARVDAPVSRKVKNVGDGDATYVIVGAAGGYVGRDGLEPESS
jgi:uncharacterized cupin superfamily protein